MKFLINLIKKLFVKLKNNHIDEYTAQCAYFTILAFDNLSSKIFIDLLV